MTDSSRDQLETERLDPEQNLVQHRRERDEQEYRDWCVNSYGMVAVGPESFHPADVLDKLAPDAARRGRDEALSQARADLEVTVCDQFPAPIAVPFQAFLEGSSAALTRLHRLRDAWESLVHLLAALALSEAAGIGSSFSPLPIREGKDQGWRACKLRDLSSDRLAVRIGLIEGVLHRAQQLGIELRITSLLPIDVLAEVRRLNVVRNGFSHESTKSEKQAREIIGEAYPVLREVLLDLREMRSIELIRVKTIASGSDAEVERLIGHAQSRRIRRLALDDKAASVALSARPIDGLDRILALAGSHLLDISPFFYAADDDTGHRTRIYEFRRKSASVWELQCVADSTLKSLPPKAHEALLGRFKSLLGDAGDEVDGTH